MAGSRSLALLLLTAVVLAGCSGGGGGEGGDGGDGDGGGGGDGGGASTTSSSSVSSGPTATAASSSSSTASATPTSTGPAPLSGNVARDIRDNSFPDGTFTITKGTTVTWTHRGSNPHSVTAEDGSFDSCAGLPAGCMTGAPGTDTFSHTFGAAGSFGYFCRVHPSMTGTVTVV
jgi:plastocyanin